MSANGEGNSFTGTALETEENMNISSSAFLPTWASFSFIDLGHSNRFNRFIGNLSEFPSNFVKRPRWEQ